MATNKTEQNFVLTATDKTKKTVSDVGKGFSGLAGKINKIGGIAAGAGAAVVGMGAAAAGALAVVTAKSFESADALGKFADRIGTSTEALAGLRHAANQTAGATDQQLDTALQRMTRRISQAAAGTGEAVKTLEALNLNAAELNKLSPDQQFAAVADAIKEVDKQGDKVRLTFGLFDSEGVGLVNTLNQGSEGLKQFRTEAEQLGLALDRGSIAKIESANDAMDKVKKSAVGVGNAMATAVAPTITGIANLWVENVAKTTDWGKIAEKTVNAAVIGFGWIADGIQNNLTVLQAAKVGVLYLSSAFAELFINLTEAAATFLNFFGTGLKAMVIGSLELVRKLGEALALLPGRAGESGDFLVANIDKMQTGIDNALTFDAEKVTRGINGIGAAYESELEKLDEMVRKPKWSEGILQLHTKWEQQATETAERVKNTVASAYVPPGSDSGSSGPDEKTVERMAQQLNTVTQFLATEEQRVSESYLKRQTILDESLAAGLISETTYANQSIALEQKKQAELTDIALKHQSERDKFAAMSFKNQSKNVVDFLVTNTSELSKHSKVWFNINKGLSIAQAIMNTSEAVTKTLAAYPAPLNFGLAAVVAANGAAQVASIAKQSFSESGSSSGSVASVSSGSVDSSINSAVHQNVLETYAAKKASIAASESEVSSASADSTGMTVIFQFQGDVNGFDKDELTDSLIEKFADKINSDDFVFIQNTSRQAQELKAG